MGSENPSLAGEQLPALSKDDSWHRLRGTVTWHLAELSFRMISVPAPHNHPHMQMKTLRPGRLGHKPKTTEPEAAERPVCLRIPKHVLRDLCRSDRAVLLAGGCGEGL